MLMRLASSTKRQSRRALLGTDPKIVSPERKYKSQIKRL